MRTKTEQIADKVSEHNGSTEFLWYSVLYRNQREWCQLRLIIYPISLLSILNWPLCVASMLNIGGCSSLPGAETRGASSTVPSGLCATLYLPSARPPQKRR